MMSLREVVVLLEVHVYGGSGMRLGMTVERLHETLEWAYSE